MKSRRRPRLVAVSEEVKAWSAALADEMSGWPQVERRSFFGFTALYRDKLMFAVLPRTRSLEIPNAITFRLDAPSPALRARLTADARITATEVKKARWFSFELRSTMDLHDALDWLGRAYDAAAAAKRRR